MDSLTTEQLACGRVTAAKVDVGGCHGGKNKDTQLKPTRAAENVDLFSALPRSPPALEARRYYLLDYYI